VTRSPAAAVPAVNSAAPAAPRPAGLVLRLAAMIYDAVLVFGIGFAAVLVVLLLTGAPDPGAPRLPLQGALFVAIGTYFSWCWSRTGQTLALKTWNLQVTDTRGHPPSLARAIARYVLAYTLALPGMAYIALAQPSRAGALGALALGFIGMLTPALFDHQRRLLHDHCSGTLIARTD
jgi:uncharacterized RDD family membrane protein YckC